MNALHPLIEELASAHDHATRAGWLLACPTATLISYQDTIRRRLLQAIFAEGAAYLEFELTVNRAVRTDGLARHENPLRTRMIEIRDAVPGPAG